MFVIPGRVPFLGKKVSQSPQGLRKERKALSVFAVHGVLCDTTLID